MTLTFGGLTTAHAWRLFTTATRTYFLSAFFWSLLEKPCWQVLRWRPGTGYDEPEVVATFVPDKYCLIHSFSVTQKNVVFLCSPFILSLRERTPKDD